MGRSWDRIPVGARFNAPIENGPGAHPAAYAMCTGSFPGVKRPGRDIELLASSSAKVKERVELYLCSGGSRCRSCLRHCATSWKVAGSIPDGVTGFFFHWHNFPTALWPRGQLSLYQKWVLGMCPGGKGGRCVWLTTLPPSCADYLEIWEPHPPGTLGVCPGL